MGDVGTSSYTQGLIHDLLKVLCIMARYGLELIQAEERFEQTVQFTECSHHYAVLEEDKTKAVTVFY